MIIFDLDQTLVDTSPVEHLRAGRKWSQVMSSVPRLREFDGISDLISEIDAIGQKIAIVTHSPDMVAKAFVKKFGWPIEVIIGYHQAPRKPNPTGMRLAMEKLSSLPGDTLHVGDRAEDTEACKAAGIHSIGAAWGLEDHSSLVNSAPDFMAYSVGEARDYILSRIKS